MDVFRLLAGLDGVFEKAAIRCDEVAVTPAIAFDKKSMNKR